MISSGKLFEVQCLLFRVGAEHGLPLGENIEVSVETDVILVAEGTSFPILILFSIF
jgi:hypothetical protein